MDFLKAIVAFTMPKIIAAGWKLYILTIAYATQSLEEFASLAFILSALDIAKVVSDLGAENVLVRRLSNKNRVLRDSTYCLLIIRQVLACLIALVFTVILFFYFSNRCLIILVLLLVIAPMQSLIALTLQRTEKYNFAFYLTLLYMLTALAILTVKQHLPLEIILIAPEIAIVIFGLLSIRINEHLIILKKKSRRMLSMMPIVLHRQIHPLMLSIIVVLYMRLDVLIARPFFGNEIQGKYSMLIRIIDPIFAVISILISAFTIWISKRAGAVDQISKRLNYATSPRGIIISMSIALLLGVIADNVITLKVLDSTTVTFSFMILCAATGLRIVNATLSSYFIRDGLFRMLSKAAVINFFVTILCISIFAAFKLNPLIILALSIILGELANYSYQRYQTLARVRGKLIGKKQ
jgi:O-antigen/teichoic acid export membrane protein